VVLGRTDPLDRRKAVPPCQGLLREWHLWQMESRDNRSNESLFDFGLVGKERLSQAPSPRHGRWAFAMFRLTTSATLPYLSISTAHRTSLSLLNVGVTPGRRWLMETNTRRTRTSRDQERLEGGSSADLLYSPPSGATPTSARPLRPHSDPPTYPPSSASRIARVPPPGFAYATLMPGKVVRLRILTPRPIIWAPGQHVLLFIPHVSKWTTHPFTINGCFDGETETGEGRVVELIIRAKTGFTKDLWEAVCKLIVSGPTDYPFASQPDPESSLARKVNNGVLLRAFIDGPFGSSIRAHWGNHSTVMIITGGTGITFGAAILEYLALCISGRDGQTLGGRPGGWGAQGFRTTRVRFVWLVREFCKPFIFFVSLC
jgi:hypothetical protein